MSWDTVRWVQNHAPVKGSEYHVLLALALRLGRHEKAWPSLRRLAWDTRLSKSTVCLAVQKLEASGLIEVDRFGKSNYYKVVRLSDCQWSSGRTVGGPMARPKHPTLTPNEKHPPAGRPALMVDMNANETLSLLKKEKPLSDPAMVEKLNGMTQSLSNATRVWRDMHARWHGGFLPEFTAKEMGQFKMFLQRSPSGRALAILGISIRHWDMISRPKGMHRPHIGFLLTKLGEADQLLHEVLVREERKETKGPQEMEVGW